MPLLCRLKKDFRSLLNIITKLAPFFGSFADMHSDLSYRKGKQLSTERSSCSFYTTCAISIGSFYGKWLVYVYLPNIPRAMCGDTFREPMRPSLKS